MDKYSATGRSIIHMDLDSFFVSVECLRNPALKGKPLIIGGSSRRGVVASCSYEARRFGVRSAMPVALARQLCPQLINISGDMDAYSKYSRLITDIIRDDVPLFEKSSIDEFYIDATGMDRFFGTVKWAGELRQKIMKESGLPISMGLSINKLVSKVATGEAKPNGQRHIPYGMEKAFLAPLPIQKIPMIGDKTARFLTDMGIYNVRTLREMPVEVLAAALGSNGVSLWKKANGEDNSPVIPFREQKSISTETTFNKDTIDVQFLKNVLTAMVEKLGFKIREKQKLTACITVKLRYSNFDTVSKQCRIAYTSSDHTLIKKAQELFDQLYNRRMLIRLIGVRFSELVHGNYQISLFDDTEETIRLYEAMDKIKHKHGSLKLMRASSLDLNLRLKDSIPTFQGDE
ncbi:DNA polymerase IV [Marinigracilibium pacificum]|uniref:DNA polymerase IV n=1 Tax=Marinigracilibium pacificum TaxID=2729599 RepID=A0A848IY75_9BACT|nr:DNA polymerase IV [Marinigracilibium pacificum]NMM48118.1 DNA polymerase IV [Marinigracilibium pacificum]